MAEPPPVLECIDVSAGYTDAQGRRAPVLSGVSFAMSEGDRVAILGRSGSGKSTLLRLLNRFDDPIAGTVRYRGKSLVDWDPLVLRRRVALVAQTPVVFEGSVRDNLLARPEAHPPDEPMLRSVLDDVDLDAEILDTLAASLSVGEQQRVCLARTLLGSPDTLLLDEPTASLDPRTAARLTERIASLSRARSLTVVVVTHDPQLVRSLGGRVLVIADGHLDSSPTDADVARFLEGA